MNLQLFEILESRINSSATPIAPFNPAAHISRVAGPFVQAAVQASVDSTPATPPTPSLDVETLLHNRQAAIDPLPTLSVIYDAQSVVHYDLPVWNGVPTSAQIHQGDLGDCYLIADLQAMADQNPAKLMQSITIYSDGTYGVTFHHIWTTTEIRVDGNFGSQQAVPTGALWGVIIEKAYAAYRFGQNTYASIVTGTADDFSWAMGWSVGGVTIEDAPSSFVQDMQAAFDSHWSLTVGTPTDPRDDAPLIGSHEYEVVSISGSTAADLAVTLRNPWGFDGVNQDSDPSDGLVTVNWAQIMANFDEVSAAY